MERYPFHILFHRRKVNQKITVLQPERTHASPESNDAPNQQKRCGHSYYDSWGTVPADEIGGRIVGFAIRCVLRSKAPTTTLPPQGQVSAPTDPALRASPGVPLSGFNNDGILSFSMQSLAPPSTGCFSPGRLTSTPPDLPRPTLRPGREVVRRVDGIGLALAWRRLRSRRAPTQFPG